jgi:hypothetical protein
VPLNRKMVYYCRLVVWTGAGCRFFLLIEGADDLQPLDECSVNWHFILLLVVPEDLTEPSDPPGASHVTWRTSFFLKLAMRLRIFNKEPVVYKIRGGAPCSPLFMVKRPRLHNSPPHMGRLLRCSSPIHDQDSRTNSKRTVLQS